MTVGESVVDHYRYVGADKIDTVSSLSHAHDQIPPTTIDSR
jgi:hypothetical protein